MDQKKITNFVHDGEMKIATDTPPIPILTQTKHRTFEWPIVTAESATEFAKSETFLRLLRNEPDLAPGQPDPRLVINVPDSASQALVPTPDPISQIPAPAQIQSFQPSPVLTRAKRRALDLPIVTAESATEFAKSETFLRLLRNEPDPVLPSSILKRKDRRRNYMIKPSRRKFNIERARNESSQYR